MGTPLISKMYMPFSFSIKGIVGYFLPPLFIFLFLFGYCSFIGTMIMYLEVFLLLCFLIVISLLTFHLFLILNNQTSFEWKNNIKKYSRGYLFNLKLIFGPNLLLIPLNFLWPWLNIRSRELDCIYGRPQYTK